MDSVLGTLHSKHWTLLRRSPVLLLHGPGRLVLSFRSIPGPAWQVENARCGPPGFQIQTDKVCLQVQGSFSISSGCSVGSAQADICITSLETSSSSASQEGKGHSGALHCSGLAKADTYFTVAGVNSMAVVAQILRGQGNHYQLWRAYCTPYEYPRKWFYKEYKNPIICIWCLSVMYILWM